MASNRHRHRHQHKQESESAGASNGDRGVESTGGRNSRGQAAVGCAGCAGGAGCAAPAPAPALAAPPAAGKRWGRRSIFGGATDSSDKRPAGEGKAKAKAKASEFVLHLDTGQRIGLRASSTAEAAWWVAGLRIRLDWYEQQRR